MDTHSYMDLSSSEPYPDSDTDFLGKESRDASPPSKLSTIKAKWKDFINKTRENFDKNTKERRCQSFQRTRARAPKKCYVDF
jgi:hypothetical protein